MFSNLLKDKERIKTTILSSFAWGLLAHLMAITSNIAFGDTVMEFFPIDYTPQGSGAALGRWNAMAIYNIRNILYGNNVRFNRCYDILLGIFLIGVFIYTIVRMLEITDTWSIVAICGYALTSSMMLMYSYYSLMIPNAFPGLILGSIGAFFLCRNNIGIKEWLLSACIICLSIGIYQCFIMVSVCAVLVHFFFDVIKNDYSLKQFIKKGLYYLSSLVCGMILYVIVNNVVIRILNTGSTAAGHLDSYGFTSVIDYYYRLRTAYSYFFSPPSYAAEVIPYFPKALPVLYKILLVIMCVCVLFYLLNRSISIIKKIEVIVLVILMPAAFNLMYIITNEATVHSLHLWNYVILFAAIVKFMSEMEFCEMIGQLAKYIRFLVIFIMLVMSVYQSKHCNLCHVKMSLVQSECVRYYTSLCTRIQDTKGYYSGMKIMYLNEFDRDDKDVPVFDAYENLTGLITVCKTMSDVIGDEAYWKEWMAIYCGFDPVVIEDEQLKERVTQMDIPHYPSDGSIIIVDDVLVVNF